MNMLKIAVVAATLAMAGAANANILFSEDFNSGAFQGGSLGLDPAEQFSDQWNNVNYTFINDANGWSFAGQAFYVRNTDNDSEGAVLLNEGGGVAVHLLSGLKAGKTYYLSLLVGGDNRPGSPYVLNGAVNGGSLFSYAGVDLARGTNPGTPLTYAFQAQAGANTLRFSQASVTQGSPIIDNVTISTGVPEPMTWALMILGFGGAGAMLRRRGALAA